MRQPIYYGMSALSTILHTIQVTVNMDTIWSSFQSRSGLCKSNMALFPGPCPAFHHEHERQKVGWRPWNKATTFMEWTPDQTPEKPKSWMDIMWRKGYEYVISKQTVVNGASMVGETWSAVSLLTHSSALTKLYVACSTATNRQLSRCPGTRLLLSLWVAVFNKSSTSLQLQGGMQLNLKTPAKQWAILRPQVETLYVQRQSI